LLYKIAIKRGVKPDKIAAYVNEAQLMFHGIDILKDMYDGKHVREIGQENRSAGHF